MLLPRLPPTQSPGSGPRESLLPGPQPWHRSFLCFKVLSVLCAPYLSLQLSAQTPLLQESLSPTQGRASHPTAPHFSWAPPSKRHLPHWCRDLYILTYITHTVTHIHINIYMCTHCRSLTKSRLTLTTSWTAVHRAPLSMGFSRQDTGVGCHFLLQEIFPTQGSNSDLLHRQVDSLLLSHQGSPILSLTSVSSPAPRLKCVEEGWAHRVQP